MASNEETNAAGTDTRPPMLVESDYDSWKIRIHRYIRGKPLGKLIWNSIQNGPSPHPMVTDAPTEGQTGVNMPRMKLDSEFTPEETNRENADTQAEIILSQGLPRHIFNILNQTNTAKEIWDNVEMLMQGSGRTLQQRKEDDSDPKGSESPVLAADLVFAFSHFAEKCFKLATDRVLPSAFGLRVPVSHFDHFVIGVIWLYAYLCAFQKLLEEIRQYLDTNPTFHDQRRSETGTPCLEHLLLVKYPFQFLPLSPLLCWKKKHT
ncbi:hypothetical protein Tco_1106852 [Tanacetum coccineum]